MPFRQNVFILGAGFSADAGAPVMRDFLQRAKDLWVDPGSGFSGGDREAFGRVFEFLYELRVAQAKMTLDIENIEHLFSLAEMDIESGKSDGSLRRDLIFLILRTLESSIRPERLGRGRWGVGSTTGREPGTRRPIGVEAHYGELFAALASRRWRGGAHGVPPDGFCLDTIITMNYDCFLDDALVRVGVRPDYELPGATYPGEFTGLGFRIGLLKLHGSANWLRCTSESCTGRIWISSGGPAGRLEYLNGRPCPACGQPPEPVIVPPTWAKGGHREMFAPVWRRALRVLQEAGRIFIIGYSMPNTDTFFQYMLGLALARNEKIDRAIVVNRNGEALQKYEELFLEHFRGRRYFPEEKSSLEFITNGHLLRALGQDLEELDLQMIEASGFTAG